MEFKKEYFSDSLWDAASSRWWKGEDGASCPSQPAWELNHLHWGGEGCYPEVEEGHCINYNWQWRDVINFTNSDVSSKARIRPTLPKLSAFPSVGNFTVMLGQQSSVIGSLGKSNLLLGFLWNPTPLCPLSVATSQENLIETNYPVGFWQVLKWSDFCLLP